MRLRLAMAVSIEIQMLRQKREKSCSSSCTLSGPNGLYNTRLRTNICGHLFAEVALMIYESTLQTRTSLHAPSYPLPIIHRPNSANFFVTAGTLSHTHTEKLWQVRRCTNTPRIRSPSYARPSFYKSSPLEVNVKWALMSPACWSTQVWHNTN